MLFLYPKLYAQDNEPLKNESTKNNYYWLGAGGGIPDLGVNINLNYIVKKVLITGDFAGVVKFNNSEFWDGVDKDCDAYSLLLGTYITDRAGFASISTGVSYISGLDRSESEAYNPGTESVKFRTLGLPIKAQFALHGKYVGVGISGIFNLNKNMPYGLAMLNLSLGKLR
jgi:hypothetical protein